MAKHFNPDTGGTLTTSLVSYYPLSDVTDAFGANTLTNNNAVTFTTGKVGNAASFNGTTQYLNCGVLSTAVANVTMAAWVHITSVSQHGCFVHNGKADDSNGYALGVGNGDFTTDGNTLMLLLEGVAFKTSGVSIGTGWHLVGVSRNASTWKFWLDGATVGTTYTTNPIAPSTDFLIGRSYTSATDRSFNDLIDEVGFWNKELSAQEWTDLYNGGNGQTIIPDQILAPTADTFSGLTDAVTLWGGWRITVSDTFTGILDTVRLYLGWTKQTKNTSTWTDQPKS